jgi:hypothetical protein
MEHVEHLYDVAIPATLWRRNQDAEADMSTADAG